MQPIIHNYALQSAELCFTTQNISPITNMPYVHKEHIDFDGDGWHEIKLENLTPYVHYEHILFDGDGWHSRKENSMHECGILKVDTFNNFTILVGQNTTSTAINSLLYSTEITAKEDYKNQLELIRNRFGP